MLSNDKKNEQSVILKIAIRCDNINKYVSILVFVDKYKHELMDIIIGISEDSRFFNITNVNKYWTEIEKNIMINSRINPSNNLVIDLLTTSIKDMLTPSNIDLILLSEMHSNTRSVINIFDKVIREIMSDNPSLIDASFQNVVISDIERQKELIKNEIETGIYDNIDLYAESNETQAKPEEENNKLSYILIDSSFVLSPISGKSLPSISVGDTVMIRIARNTLDEQRIIMTLKGKPTKDHKFIVPAEIIQKSYDKNGGVKILLKLLDGVYSKIEENDPIKIKMYDATEFNGYESDKNKPKNGIFPKWIINALIFFSIWTIALVIVALYVLK